MITKHDFFKEQLGKKDTRHRWFCNGRHTHTNPRRDGKKRDIQRSQHSGHALIVKFIMLYLQVYVLYMQTVMETKMMHIKHTTNQVHKQ